MLRRSCSGGHAETRSSPCRRLVFLADASVTCSQDSTLSLAGNRVRQPWPRPSPRGFPDEAPQASLHSWCRAFVPFGPPRAACSRGQGTQAASSRRSQGQSEPGDSEQGGCGQGHALCSLVPEQVPASSRRGPPPSSSPAYQPHLVLGGAGQSTNLRPCARPATTLGQTLRWTAHRPRPVHDCPRSAQPQVSHILVVWPPSPSQRSSLLSGGGCLLAGQS